MEQVYNKIMQYLQMQDYQAVERLCLFEISQRANPEPLLLFHLGNAARFMGKIKPALVAFEAVLALQPDDINTLQACASCHEALNEYETAYNYILKAANLEPGNVLVQANMAVALERLGKSQEALAAYEKALDIDQHNLTANINLGTLLYRLGKKSNALEHNRQAHKRHPEKMATLYNLVDALIWSYQYQEALDYCNAGLSIEPRHAHLMFKKSMVLSCLRRFDEAQACLSKARIINPDVIYDFLPYVRNLPAHVTLILEAKNLFLEGMYEAQLSCFWRDRKEYLLELNKMIDDDLHLYQSMRGAENGFKILSLDVDATRRYKLMQAISSAIDDFSNHAGNVSYKHQKTGHSKIRIGYLSPDFRQHATAILAHQIFKMHDRASFEIYGYSLANPNSPDDFYRHSVESNCDVFRDVSGLHSRDIADLVHADQIDILVDMAGYTTFSRTDVMAKRPAPLQMQYLGFSCTMGAEFIDYALIDRQLCLDGKADEWHERPIRLPHALYPYDNEIDCRPTDLKRSDFGLPDDQFVFCCFNNSYKIEPLIFERWMNVLKAVPSSVLWLLGKGLDIQSNLEREAEARGVDKSRLVFTGRLPMDKHLPRYQLADLFLDTYWVNAHTTGAEALWQGLPLITIMGEVSSARGAASILTALEMPELIVQDFDEYEQLAIFYATHPAEYAAMREKLKAKRYTAPMYNTKLTVKHIESVYKLAWERYQAGLPPTPIDVPEILDPALRKSIH